MPPATPPSDVEMDMVTTDTRHPQPPAHLAARFSRRSTSRRRSSANSSRRSSLSSIHSHHSNLSCHGGPRSTHIAQHLRRASIIESRKTRLAERAAHAEQVRLRAAAAKATPRVSCSEEKALAAQAAREKLLAEITARSKEEVRRAKKVAEETKEKKAAELARLKEEMTEKYAQAARRKSLYQSVRRPRTASLAAVEERKFNPVVRAPSRFFASRVIQRSWRAYSRRKVLRAFLSHNLTMLNAVQLSFEDLTTLVQADNSLASASNVLNDLGFIETNKAPPEALIDREILVEAAVTSDTKIGRSIAASGGEDEAADRGAARVFLSAYVILAHPQQALSHSGQDPQEQQVLAKASALLSAFEKFVALQLSSQSTRRLYTADLENLSFLWNDFNSVFHAWKSQDLTVIIDVMVNSFVNLDLIIQATKDDRDGHVAEDYQEAIRHEQIKLLARLKRLAGSENALNLVKTAVRKARKHKTAGERKPSVEHVPRATTPVQNTMGVSLPTPPATPLGRSTRTEQDSTRFVSRLGQTMTVLPSNREIAHEMQITGTYEVQQQPWTDSRKQFMDSLRSSMRDSMQEGHDEVAAGWTSAMAILIKEKLLNLITPRHPLYERIDTLLDPKFIEQQCRNGVFSYSQFFSTLAGLIAQICSPGRDEIVRTFVQDNTNDTIDRLFALINILDLMTLDHINFQFRMAAQPILDRGHEHEMALFENNLSDGIHSLSSTKRWWRSARSNLTTTTTSGNAIYARGIVDLILGNSHLEYSNLPETLRLDWIRFLHLRARVFHMVAVSAVLLTTKIRLRRNRESVWTKDAERLTALNLASTDESRIVSLIESSHMMPDSTREGLLNFVGRVLPAAVFAAGNATNAEQERLQAIQNHETYRPAESSSSRGDVFTEQISTYVLKSMREHVFARLAASSTAEKVRVTTSASEVLARAGMPEFVNDVGQIVEVLEKVRFVDLKAHEKWYDEIARQVE